MHRFFPPLLAVSLVAAGSFPAAFPAHAQDAGPKICQIFGMGFSAGVVARVGNGPRVCKPDGTWGPTDDQAAGCVYDSKFYSTGALRPLPDATKVLECLSDGTWSPVPVPSTQKKPAQK